MLSRSLKTETTEPLQMAKKRTADRHRQPKKAFHAPAEMFKALEAFINSQLVPPDESAVLRQALREFLEQHGFWPPSKEPSPPLS